MQPVGQRRRGRSLGGGVGGGPLGPRRGFLIRVCARVWRGHARRRRGRGGLQEDQQVLWEICRCGLRVGQGRRGRGPLLRVCACVCPSQWRRGRAGGRAGWVQTGQIRVCAFSRRSESIPPFMRACVAGPGGLGRARARTSPVPAACGPPQSSPGHAARQQDLLPGPNARPRPMHGQGQCTAKANARSNIRGGDVLAAAGSAARQRQHSRTGRAPAGLAGAAPGSTRASWRRGLELSCGSRCNRAVAAAIVR